MVRSLICLMLVVVCAETAAPAQNGPRFAGESTLANSKLSARVRRRIERAVLLDNDITDPYDKEDAEGQVLVSRVRLGPEGRSGLRIWGGDAWRLCGKSNCDFWIFDPISGAELFIRNGYELNFSKTVHHGLYDIWTKHQYGAMSGQFDFYQFDGKQYRHTGSRLTGS